MKGAAKTLFDFSALRADGTKMGFNELKGKVVLVVNVAFKCGYTNKVSLLHFPSSHP